MPGVVVDLGRTAKPHCFDKAFTKTGRKRKRVAIADTIATRASSRSKGIRPG
jgi:hypothetical protein